jgi:hypothetical protein
MRTLLRHLRQNTVAYVALFVALGGTGYAAVNLPAGSVGTKQLKNHSIQPVKFDPRFINGTVRAWAVVESGGKVQAGKGKPVVTVGTGGRGVYVVKWRAVSAPAHSGCFAIGGLTDDGQPGSAEASLGFSVNGPKIWVVDVSTYGASGNRAAQAFYTAVIC